MNHPTSLKESAETLLEIASLISAKQAMRAFDLSPFKPQFHIAPFGCAR
jgi:hypothetical protein